MGTYHDLEEYRARRRCCFWGCALRATHRIDSDDGNADVCKEHIEEMKTDVWREVSRLDNGIIQQVRMP